ncbi:MAG: polysaccharide biosynthesis tyrosine autokinase [Thiothrix sp.]|nr:polysaccharide biosynthesis tyrosine autokinase [Thiothrix sp.]HPQ94696.1 polysaccharide biosynthesis tyrosine autokinase [Thiolinea sp.]
MNDSAPNGVLYPQASDNLPQARQGHDLKHYDYLEQQQQDDDDDEIDLKELWQIIVRRKWLILTIALLVFTITTLATLMMTPIYRASATLQINPDVSQILEYDVSAQGAQASIGKDYYQTQYELLKSRLLAGRVIEELNLEPYLKKSEGEELARPFFADTLDEISAYVAALKNGLLADSSEGDQNPTDGIPGQSEVIQGETPLPNLLLENVSIEPVKNSQIVVLNYDDPDPERAFSIANTMATSFVELNMERRREAARYAETAIAGEMITALSKLRESETALNNYAKEQDIIVTDDKRSLADRRVQELTTAISKVEQDRIKAESEYNQHQSQAASSALDNPAMQQMKQALAKLESEYQAKMKSSSAFDDPTIRVLKQRLAELQSQYQAELKASKTFDNPVVRSMKEQLTRLQAQYEGELKGSAANDNPTVRSLREQQSRLQAQYQAELASSTAQDSPVIRTMKQQLATLQSQLQGGSSSANAFDNPTIQNLKQQLATFNGEYQQKLQIYKPAYPIMVQLKQKIDTIRQQLNQENQSAKSNLTQQIRQLQTDIARETGAQSSTTRANLKQQIEQLNREISQQYRAIETSTRANLKQQIDELTQSIATESSLVRNTTLNNLKLQIEQLQRDIAHESRMLDINTQTDLGQQIATLRAKIATESGTINDTVAADLKGKLDAAREQEVALGSELSQAKLALIDLRDKNIDYNELARQVETNRNIYTGLLERQKQVGVAGGIGNNNISVVDSAVIPYDVYKPNTKLNLALGAVLGTFLGVVMAFLLEFMDDRIKSAADLERLVPVPVLGLIPLAKQRGSSSKLAMMTQDDPRSPMAEAYRSLRTNLTFATSHGAPHIMAVTSSASSEGKSTSCINIGTAFAQIGKRVLLIDADLRNPSIHKLLGMPGQEGFTNFLTGQITLDTIIHDSPIPGMSVITAGPIPPNPVELLSSHHMDKVFELISDNSNGNYFDMILFDMPPVLGLADALIITSRVEATLLVVAMGESRKQVLQGAWQRLKLARANIVGIVSTKARQSAGYGYHYSYEYYGYGSKNHKLSHAT